MGRMDEEVDGGHVVGPWVVLWCEDSKLEDLSIERSLWCVIDVEDKLCLLEKRSES